MAYVKLVKEQYPNQRAVICLFQYINNLSKLEHEVFGGNNILFDYVPSGNFVVEQFLVVQHGQVISRRLYHVIVSFDNVIDNANLRFAYDVGMYICRMYREYQSYFAVHEDKEYLHIHIVFNNCPICSDKPKLTSTFNIFSIRQAVDTMVDYHLSIL